MPLRFPQSSKVSLRRRCVGYQSSSPRFLWETSCSLTQRKKGVEPGRFFFSFLVVTSDLYLSLVVVVVRIIA